MLLFAALGGLSGGCTGQLTGEASLASAGAGPAPVGPTATLPETAFTPAAGTLRRLTRSQYERSIQRLLGDLPLPAELETDPAIAGFQSVAASALGISERRVEQLEAAALQVAQAVVASEPLRTRLVPCQAAGVVGAECLAQVVVTFGQRAFRRPLTELERTRYVALATERAGETGEPWAGVEAVLVAFLQSPSFLYRRELGIQQSSTLHRVLDGYELASRLAFFIEDRTPDDQLLESAAAGALATPEGLLAQAERLLSSDAARESLREYATEALHLRRLQELPQLDSLFPLLTPTLGQSMQSEALMVFESVALDATRDFRDLFDTRQTYLNGELARLYGLAEPATGAVFSPVTLAVDSKRVGLLGQAAFLAGSSHATSPSATRRGQFVREYLLCDVIPPPPPNVATTLPEDTPATGPRTARQKLEVHRQNPTCAGCHALMDPIGLALEGFDALGSWRDTEGGLPLDLRSDLDGLAFEGLGGLASLLRERPQVSACAVRNLFRFAMGHEEQAGEAALLDRLDSEFRSGGFRFRSLVLSLVTSPEFRVAGVLE